MRRMKPDRRQGRTKHVPQRACVACRQAKAKRELTRLVRVAGGGVEVDASGKAAGRGAYLCSAWECWETGLKRGRLERALRTVLSQADRERLAEQGKAILQGAT